MRDGDCLLVAFWYVVTAQGKARRVEMIEALSNAFLDTDGQGQFTQQQLTAPPIACAMQRLWGRCAKNPCSPPLIAVCFLPDVLNGYSTL